MKREEQKYSYYKCPNCGGQGRVVTEKDGLKIVIDTCPSCGTPLEPAPPETVKELEDNIQHIIDNGE